MLCGCSKEKKLPRPSSEEPDHSGYGLLPEIQEYNGVEASESWCPVLTCDNPTYPGTSYGLRRHNLGFDSGIDTGQFLDLSLCDN